MDGASARFMKRKVKSGDVTVDFDARALIVEYEVEAAVLGDYGEVLQTETKSHRKVIRIKTLTEDSDIPTLAEEIVDRCTLIHESKLALVIELLYALQERMALESRSGRPKKDKEARRAARKKAKAAKEREAKEAAAAAASSPVPRVDASMDKLEEYMEKLYDESLDDKTDGALHILELTKDPRNLETIAQDESLMGALSRTTKDDYKKSTDLAIALVQIFFSFSQFSQLHPYLTTYRVGDVSLRILEFEHRRHEARMEDLRRLTELAEAQAAGDTEREASLRRNSMRGLEEAKKKDEEESKLDTGDGGAGSGAGSGAGGGGSSRRGRGGKKEKKARMKPLPEGKVDLPKARHKTTAMMKKQERLLYVCIHVLLNLAENVQIERKMTKRNIITFLVPLLERDNPELVMLVVTFLRKLSIFEENKNLMAEAGVVPLLVRFVPMTLPDVLMQAILRLMFNLSFDKELCQKMVEANVLPPLVTFLKKPLFRAVVLRLLYHISQDDGCKTMFTYTEAIPLVLKLIINFPQNFVAKELVALGINLTHSPRNAEVVADGEGLKLLVSRVLKTRDTLLMKMIRNVSLWSRREQENLPEGEENPHKGLWAPFVRDLYRLARTDEPDLLVEVLGTLANITIDDLPRTVTFPALIEDNRLVEHVQRQLLRGADDDIVLEIVMLIGTWCADPRVPPLLADGGCTIARFMGDLLSTKSDDPEMCLQALFTLYKMMQTRAQAALEEVVYGTEAVPRMCDMMSHKHTEVVRYARLCLEIAIDYDKYDGHRGLWREVQLRRYQLYNREYVHYMAAEDGEDSGLEDSKWEEALQRAQRAAPMHHPDDDEPVSPSTSYDGTAAWSPGSPLNIGRHHQVAVDFEALGYSADGTAFDHSPRTSPRAGAGGRPGAGDDEWWGEA